MYSKYIDGLFGTLPTVYCTLHGEGFPINRNSSPQCPISKGEYPQTLPTRGCGTKVRGVGLGLGIILGNVIFMSSLEIFIPDLE